MARLRLPLGEYLRELLSLVEPDPRVESAFLPAAVGRVLAGPVRAGVDIPVFDNSAMDGYAVRHDDVAAAPVRLRVIGDLPAGSDADPAFGPGECVRIMTGAPLPTCADTVVPVEDTDGGVRAVEILVAPRPEAHVRRSGEDVARGSTVAAAGAVVTPALAGLLAAVGVAEVAVRPRPVVAVRPTGDELVSGGGPLRRGQIHESNGVLLAAALERDGMEVVTGPPIPDDPGRLTAWLDEVSDRADLVLLAGGVSVGSYDVVRDVLQGRAGGTFRTVAMQPGKPQGWARWQGRVPVVAVPGNPVSAALSYEVLVRPVLDKILGRAGVPELTAVAEVDWRSPAGRLQLQPVALRTAPDGRLLARPAHAGGSASHLVSSLAAAHGIALVPEDVTDVAAGDLLRVRAL
jgi:molybdopterin molybdotransferase